LNYDKEYPLAKAKVDGLKVTDNIPNQDSIGATFTDYTILEGIREVSMDGWGTPNQYFYAKDDLDRAHELAQEILENKWIDPLIIAIEDNGEPYILEGGHRYAALYALAKKSFPALVVVEGSDVEASLQSKVVAALQRVVARYDQALDEALKDILDNWEDHKGSGDPFKDPMKPDQQDIDTMKEIYNRVKGIYRCIGFEFDGDPKDKDVFEEISFNDLGVYWATEEDKAICYWGRDSDFQITVHAETPKPEDVDWVASILQMVTPDYSGEYEMRLKEGSPIRVTKVELFDNRGTKRTLLREINPTTKVLASSHDFKILEDLEGDWNTEEHFLSKEGDSEWEYYLSELDEDEEPLDRAVWAKEQDECYRDYGYPTHYFSGVKKVHEGTWLAHFTDADPQTIIDQGFKGKDFSILGLTTRFVPDSNEGPYGFAYEADSIGHGHRYHDDFGKYGTNLVLFKAKEAVRAYHSGDEEYQVIFVVDTVTDMYAVYGTSEGLETEKNGEEFVCDRDQECVDNVINFLDKA